MARRIIQIVMTETMDRGQPPNILNTLVALCDDGTLWGTDPMDELCWAQMDWKRLKNVPQEELDNE